jgi:hypothetical protein
MAKTSSPKYKVLPEKLGQGSLVHYVKPGDTVMVPCDLDTASQAELKILYDYGHPFVTVDGAAQEAPAE